MFSSTTGLSTQILTCLESLPPIDFNLIKAILNTSLPHVTFELNNLPSINVVVDCRQSIDLETSTLKNLFQYCLTQNTKLKFNIFITDPFKSVSTYSFENFTHIMPHRFPQFLQNCKFKHINDNATVWSVSLLNEFIDVIKCPTNHNDVKTLLDKLAFVYAIHHAPKDLDGFLLLALELLIKNKCVTTELKKIEEKHWRRMVNNYPHPNKIISLLFSSENIEGFEIVQSLFEKPINLINENNNSLLHLCAKHPLLLKHALKLTPDINCRNKLGQTPLHIAAIEGDTAMARFLLLHGANPNISDHNDKTFWTVDSANSSGSLDLYRRFFRDGRVLKHPPEIGSQNLEDGYICGLIATSCAAKYHHRINPSLFQMVPLPARKRYNVPKGDNSLRQFCKEKHFTFVGEMFSAKNLATVIEQTECRSIIHNVKTYAQFVNIIEESIQHDLPLIIPFATNGAGLPAQMPNNTSLHWATIIGYKHTPEFSLLVAQYGSYYEIKGKDMFVAFYDIPPQTPDFHFYKVPTEGWYITHGPLKNVNFKYHKVPATDLENFRRHLIVVAPPKECGEKLEKRHVEADVPVKRARMG